MCWTSRHVAATSSNKLEHTRLCIFLDDFFCDTWYPLSEKQEIQKKILLSTPVVVVVQRTKMKIIKRYEEIQNSNSNMARRQRGRLHKDAATVSAVDYDFLGVANFSIFSSNRSILEQVPSLYDFENDVNILLVARSWYISAGGAEPFLSLLLFTS